MKRFLNILFAILSAQFLIAQDASPRILSLDDCRQLAVENNAAIKIAAHNAEAAEQVRKEAFTKYFPTITAQALGFRANKGILQFDALDIFNIELFRHGWSTSITALQPVFTGGRIANGNKLAKVGAEASKLEHQDAIENAIVTVEQYFWELEALKAKKRTLISVIQMIDTLQTQVQSAVDAGVVNMNDLLKVQLQRNDFLSDMVDLDNGISLSQKRLAQYVGLDGEEIDIDADVPLDTVPPFPTDLYIDADQALGSTIDYQLLDAQVRASELKQRMTIAENLPTIAAGAGYFYGNLLDQTHSLVAGMLTVQVPISGWWGGSHSIKKAKLATANAREEKTNLSQMLKLEMQDSWDNLTAAYRKMDIARESIGQSRENLRLNRNYYEAGISTITDLLEAQTLYRQSLDHFISAYGTFQQCKAKYINATGRTNIP